MSGVALIIVCPVYLEKMVHVLVGWRVSRGARIAKTDGNGKHEPADLAQVVSHYAIETKLGYTSVSMRDFPVAELWVIGMDLAYRGVALTCAYSSASRRNWTKSVAAVPI
jgi:hypothetical protein